MGDLPSLNEWDTFIVAAAGLVFVFISIGVARWQNYNQEKAIQKPRGATKKV